MAHINPAIPNVGDTNWGGPLSSAISATVSQINSHDDVVASLPSTYAAKASVAPTVNTQTGTTYTPSLPDGGSTLVVLSNAAAVTVTIPTNATVAYPLATTLQFAQGGAGAVTVAAAGGVTLNGATLSTSAIGQEIWATKTGTDTWLVGVKGGGGSGSGDVKLVQHGGAVATARPTSPSVLWQGAALPVKMLAPDVWLSQSGMVNVSTLPGTNLVTNNGFETNTTGWAVANGTIARVTTMKRSGTASLAITPSNTGGDAQAQGNEFPAAAAGEAFIFRIYARTASGTSACYLRLGQYNSSFGWNGWNDNDVLPTATTIGSSEWTPISVGGVMAAGTAFLQPVFFCAMAGPVVNIDDALLIKSVAV